MYEIMLSYPLCPSTRSYQIYSSQQKGISICTSMVLEQTLTSSRKVKPDKGSYDARLYEGAAWAIFCLVMVPSGT